MSNQRLVFIDIARGILILLVVFGHITVEYHRYIFWFHMPAFFILSGMVIPDVQKRNLLTAKEFKEKVVRFCVPYLSYFVLITIVAYFSIHEKIDYRLLVKFLLGGKLLVGVYGTFWFIPCLFICQYLFFFIESLQLRKIYVVAILIVFYYGGIYVPKLLHLNYVFLNADVALIAVSYLFIGHFFKDEFTFENKRAMLITAVVTTFLMAGCVFVDTQVKPEFFELDMKYAKFNNVVLDMVIPVIFFIGVILISVLLSKSNLLSNAFSFVGRSSLHIMYLHFVVFAILQSIGYKQVWIFFLAGSIVPLIVSVLFNQYRLTRFLFNGSHEPK